MNEYTVELEARPTYGDLTKDKLLAFHDAMQHPPFRGASTGGGRDGLRVMGQIEAESATIALVAGKLAYRTALKRVFDSDELEWTTLAVAPYREPVESIPTQV